MCRSTGVPSLMGSLQVAIVSTKTKLNCHKGEVRGRKYPLFRRCRLDCKP